jgi:hypothetical protein
MHRLSWSNLMLLRAHDFAPTALFMWLSYHVGIALSFCLDRFMVGPGCVYLFPDTFKVGNNLINTYNKKHTEYYGEVLYTYTSSFPLFISSATKVTHNGDWHSVRGYGVPSIDGQSPIPASQPRVAISSCIIQERDHAQYALIKFRP